MKIDAAVPSIVNNAGERKVYAAESRSGQNPPAPEDPLLGPAVTVEISPEGMAAYRTSR
jgi:hypothetical protein